MEIRFFHSLIKKKSVKIAIENSGVDLLTLLTTALMSWND